MTNEDLSYLLDRLAGPDERALLLALRADPFDRATRNALVDCLREGGFEGGAQLVENGYTPGRGHTGVDRPLPRYLHSGAVASSLLGSGAVASGYFSGLYEPALADWTCGFIAITSGGYSAGSTLGDITCS